MNNITLNDLNFYHKILKEQCNGILKHRNLSEDDYNKVNFELMKILLSSKMKDEKSFKKEIDLLRN